MIVTDNKIIVEHSTMEESNMTRGDQYGIPKNPKNPSLGLIWKDIFEMNDSDFDAIEEYFLNATKNK